MNFLNPAYLWALSAMAVPLAIHLLSRKEGRVIRMGSLRHVRETPTRQFRSIRLNEYLLLALRMIVIAILSFLLAGWYNTDFKDSVRWMVVESGLEKRPEFIALADSLENAGYKWVWLAPGFPEQDAQPAVTTIDYAARIEELSKLPIEDAVIVASNRLTGFRGPRMALPEHFRWIDLPASNVQGEVSRVRHRPDSVLVRNGSFQPGGTTFSTTRMVGTDGRPRDTVRIFLVSDPSFETEMRVLKAVLSVVQRKAIDVLTINVVPAPGVNVAKAADWIIWLSDAPILETPASVIYLQTHRGAPIVETVAPKRFRITETLNSETVIQSNLALHLMGLLFPGTTAQVVADSLDVRTLPMSAAFTNQPTQERASVIESGNEKSVQYLFIGLLFFLVLERIIAYRRSQ